MGGNVREFAYNYKNRLVLIIIKLNLIRKTKRNLVKQKAFQSESKIYSKFTVVSIEMWIIMIGASSHMPFRTIERLFIAACLVANIIIAGSFQVFIISSLKNVELSAKL